MKLIFTLLLAVGLLALAFVPCASAAVNVERTGSENPMQEVAKSTIYGGLAGLVLGGAIALVSNGDNDADIVKWGFAGGAFLGFGYGLYWVTARPSARALLEIENGAPHLGALAIVPEPGGGARLSILGARF